MNLTYSSKIRKDGIKRIGRDARTPALALKELYSKRSIEPGELKTKCWNWTGFKNKRGYGAIGFRSKVWRVNRLSWFLHKGPIPKGKEICHRCNNPSCFRPSHLFAGTHLQNMQQAFRQKRIPIKNGENHWASKLSDKDVIEIRKRYVLGTNSRHVLAKEFGVSHGLIYLIASGVIWQHIPITNEVSPNQRAKLIREYGLKTLSGSDHCNAKLNDDTVRKIRLDHENGVGGYRILAKKFGIHRATIQSIVRRRTWKHID